MPPLPPFPPAYAFVGARDCQASVAPRPNSGAGAAGTALPTDATIGKNEWNCLHANPFR